MRDMVGDISDEEMFEDGLEVVANSAVVRAGYRKLMDEIVGKDEELSSIESHQLLGYMQLLDNKSKFYLPQALSI